MDDTFLLTLSLKTYMKALVTRHYGLLWCQDKSMTSVTTSCSIDGFLCFVTGYSLGIPSQIRECKTRCRFFLFYSVAVLKEERCLTVGVGRQSECSLTSFLYR